MPKKTIDIYRFSGKGCDYKADAASKPAKALLGGKGAGLVMMAQQGLNVPPGFTITTDVCNAYRKLTTETAKQEFMLSLMKEVKEHMAWLESQFGYTPLVSVRSGAPVSMPGMMDTILNVGLTFWNQTEWMARIGQRSTWDSQRRLIQMLGATGYGVPMSVFDAELVKIKTKAGAKADTDLTSEDLAMLVDLYLEAFYNHKGFKFPENDATEQLLVAIMAVFESWMNPRAIEYRKLNKISDDMGTAVNVQAMVFGNMGEDSGTGVLFTRNPSTGEPGMYGEFLTNAQGEDVVAGIRTPMPVQKMAQLDYNWFSVHGQLVDLCEKLEASYKDMVDIEFTVQKGELFVLQSRPGKRSARAAFKIAVDMVDEGSINIETALSRLTVDQFKTVRKPTIDPKYKVKPNLVGLNACPGVVSGKPVFSAADAVNSKVPCILVTHETNPNDIAGMAAAVGILTQTGGATSHAAVVARAMDKPCVVGATALDFGFLKMNGGPKTVTIDGSTGKVWFDTDVPVIDSSDDQAVRRVKEWCLAAQNAVEAVTVASDSAYPQRVMAAHWWGSQTVAETVLHDMAQKDAKLLSLDATSPRDFWQESDSVLGDAFGVFVPGKFSATLGKLIQQVGPTELLVAVGTKPAPNGSWALPADYAVYLTLGK